MTIKYQFQYGICQMKTHVCMTKTVNKTARAFVTVVLHRTYLLVPTYFIFFLLQVS